MFNRDLNQPLDHYVWEVVLGGKFNSFFQKFIHPWKMFIVECYIYIGYRATKLQKKFIRRARLYATIIKFDNSPFWLYYLFPNSISKHCELYFHSQWPLAYNVTELLCLLDFCLFMRLCFVFSTQIYLCLLYWCAIYIFW